MTDNSGETRTAASCAQVIDACLGTGIIELERVHEVPEAAEVSQDDVQTTCSRRHRSELSSLNDFRHSGAVLLDHHCPAGPELNLKASDAAAHTHCVG